MKMDICRIALFILCNFFFTSVPLLCPLLLPEEGGEAPANSGNCRGESPARGRLPIPPPPPPLQFQFDRHGQEGEAGHPQSPRPIASSRGGSVDRSMVATSAAVYRRVLKEVQKHVGGGDSKKHFREFVASEFRRPTGTDADARARLRLAGDYAYLLASVHHHKVGAFSRCV